MGRRTLNVSLALIGAITLTTGTATAAVRSSASPTTPATINGDLKAIVRAYNANDQAAMDAAFVQLRDHLNASIPIVSNTSTSTSTSTSTTAVMTKSTGLFAPTSWVNAKLSPTAALDANSSVASADLSRQMSSAGPNVNAKSWTTSVYTVGASEKAQAVTITGSDKTLQPAMNAVPLPADAVADAKDDGHLTVWQPSTDTLWEFWQFKRGANGTASASWGGRMQHVSTNPGHFVDDGANQSSYWGATATAIPLVAGLITKDDIASGTIDHALAMAIPQQDCIVRLPAMKTDNPCYGGGRIPAGAHFRLPADLNIDSLGLSPFASAVAHAAQTYGFVVRDHADAVTFYAEHDDSGYANVDMNLSKIPWSKAQMLTPASS